MSNELTQELVRTIFDYHDDNLYWKVNRRTKKLINKKAGYINNRGYRCIKVNQKLYLAHRLIFLYHHGHLPEYLDHIDLNKSNNDINNLREATSSQNHMNCKKLKLKNNTILSSQYKGVSWHKQSKKWIAGITINYKLVFLGKFENEIDAAKSYNKSAIEHFKEYANINKI